MAYLGNSPGVASQRNVNSFTATEGQTTFSPTAGYTLGYVDVYLNGVRLVNGQDYTASNGTQVVLATGASLNDVVEVVTYTPRGLSDGYTKAEADARYLPANAETLPSQTSNAGKFLKTDGTTATWETVPTPTPAAVSDQANSSTGFFALPVGTTAQRPASPAVGMVRMNTTTGNPEWYDNQSSNWIAFSSEPIYNIETLVIAGGGGGGAGYYAGGGGAGGYLYNATNSVASGSSFTVTIGAGGSGSTSLSSTANSGGASSLSGSVTRTAIGGGGGGSRNQTAGQSGGNGGSGGGASWPGTTGGAGTSGQGNAGGNAGSNYGAGGGGAGQAGGNAFGEPYLGSYGGNGLNSNSDWASATSTGDGGYYAGGGGAGTRSGAPANQYAGGLGGGGNGGVQSGAVPEAGMANTGGGGGGADFGDSYVDNAHYKGANGGSGIVIIRYPGPQRGSGGTVTSSGGYTYHTFTSSGTFTA